MIDGIQIDEGEYGRRAVITSPWREEIAGYMRSNNINELELNHAKGWRGNDLSFLSELPHLRSFEIIDLKIADVDPIHALHNLRKLEVITYCQTEIRFSAFPLLEKCALEWRRKATSLFGCLTLKELFVNRYKGKEIAPFANLANLEYLAILNAPVENLNGLGGLTKLRSLRIAGLRRLDSLKGIEGLPNLEALDINTCRAIGSIEEVGSLRHLRKLQIDNDGDIKSLKPLDKLSGLEFVSFCESTKILDGDLSPLMRHKNLKRVTFQNRRQYSHRREDFGVAFTG